MRKRELPCSLSYQVLDSRCRSKRVPRTSRHHTKRDFDSLAPVWSREKSVEQLPKQSISTDGRQSVIMGQIDFPSKQFCMSRIFSFNHIVSDTSLVPKRLHNSFPQLGSLLGSALNRISNKEKPTNQQSHQTDSPAPKYASWERLPRHRQTKQISQTNTKKPRDLQKSSQSPARSDGEFPWQRSSDSTKSPTDSRQHARSRK